MKIGIDLDGVVFDSETDYRVYSELYDLLELKRNSKINERELAFQKRFKWSEEEIADFFQKYQKKIVEESNYMPGAKNVLNMLKEDGHELIIITARGTVNKDVVEWTEKRFKNDNMNIFDKTYYNVVNKEEICKKENIDVMIDDSNSNCKKISESKIKTIYLKAAPSYDMEENEYLKVLYNWGEIYRYIKDLQE